MGWDDFQDSCLAHNSITIKALMTKKLVQEQLYFFMFGSIYQDLASLRLDASIDVISQEVGCRRHLSWYPAKVDRLQVPLINYGRVVPWFEVSE